MLAGPSVKHYRLLPMAILLFMGLEICSKSALADFNEGLAAYLRKDYATALQHFRPLADEGHSLSQYYIGILHYEGAGVSKDYSRALQWWFQSAQQGDFNAENSIGVAYLQGEGVKKDYALAVEWFRKAANSGLAEAQNNLANMYFNGTGVRQDDGQAIEWYAKAAEQGCPFAQTHLAHLYMQGRGGPSDPYERYVEMIKWYKLAAMKGVRYAIMTLECITKNPPPAGVMPEANRRVRQWQPRVQPDRGLPAWWEVGTLTC